jgi:hypothetical protein
MTGAEIQIALNDIGANHGGDLILNSGVYEVDSTITIPSFTRIICKGDVEFLPVQSIDTLFFMNGVECAGINGGRIIPNGAFTIGNGAFIYSDSHDCSIDGMYIDSANIGILVHSFPSGGCPSNNFISRNVTHNCNTGYYEQKAIGTRITDNTFSYSTQIGLLAECSEHSRLSRNICDYNGAHGTYLSGCQEFTLDCEHNCYDGMSGLHVRYAMLNGVLLPDTGHTIIGGQYSYNGQSPQSGNGIHIQEWSTHITVIGTVCRGNKSDGIRIHLEGATKNLVSGNICYENIDGQIIDENAGNIVVHNLTI